MLPRLIVVSNSSCHTILQCKQPSWLDIYIFVEPSEVIKQNSLWSYVTLSLSS